MGSASIRNPRALSFVGTGPVWVQMLLLLARVVFDKRPARGVIPGGHPGRRSEMLWGSCAAGTPSGGERGIVPMQDRHIEFPWRNCESPVQLNRERICNFELLTFEAGKTVARPAL